jgi:hypothetical protein
MSNVPPINVRLDNPTVIPSNWINQRNEWLALNTRIGGHPGFYPLTIKAWYVLGTIYTISASIEHLLNYRAENLPSFLSNQLNLHSRRRTLSATWQITYYPAYGLFASSVEILGRCLNGNDTTGRSTRDLTDGFKWLVSPDFNNYNAVPTTNIVVSTTLGGACTIEKLCQLRHYIAHGQATANHNQLDAELLQNLLPKLANGLEAYWAELQTSDDLCNKLAQAMIAIPPDKDHVTDISLALLSQDRVSQYRSVGYIFEQFNWQVRSMAPSNHN